MLPEGQQDDTKFHCFELDVKHALGRKIFGEEFEMVNSADTWRTVERIVGQDFCKTAFNDKERAKVNALFTPSLYFIWCFELYFLVQQYC